MVLDLDKFSTPTVVVNYYVDCDLFIFVWFYKSLYLIITEKKNNNNNNRLFEKRFTDLTLILPSDSVFWMTSNRERGVPSVR